MSCVPPAAPPAPRTGPEPPMLDGEFEEIDARTRLPPPRGGWDRRPMILVRHAESEWNRHFSRTRIDPGIPDPALTAGRPPSGRAAGRPARRGGHRPAGREPLPARARDRDHRRRGARPARSRSSRWCASAACSPAISARRASAARPRSGRTLDFAPSRGALVGRARPRPRRASPSAAPRFAPRPTTSPTVTEVAVITHWGVHPRAHRPGGHQRDPGAARLSRPRAVRVAVPNPPSSAKEPRIMAETPRRRRAAPPADQPARRG